MGIFADCGWWVPMRAAERVSRAVAGRLAGGLGCAWSDGLSVEGPELRGGCDWPDVWVISCHTGADWRPGIQGDIDEDFHAGHRAGRLAVCVHGCVARSGAAGRVGG
ncbi:hypothetical protein XMIN_4421 [Xanthomonas citri pv. mangiferaeindicae LMG 941]|nr:hypothetical protein XMIN_4421 [Xanthomonas citri pv. mangiferaeindicae LMG 941]